MQESWKMSFFLDKIDDSGNRFYLNFFAKFFLQNCTKFQKIAQNLQKIAQNFQKY